MIQYEVNLNNGVEAFGTGKTITANEVLLTCDEKALAREIHHQNSLIPEDRTPEGRQHQSGASQAAEPRGDRPDAGERRRTGHSGGREGARALRDRGEVHRTAPERGLLGGAQGREGGGLRCQEGLRRRRRQHPDGRQRRRQRQYSGRGAGGVTFGM